MDIFVGKRYRCIFFTYNRFVKSAIWIGQTKTQRGYEKLTEGSPNQENCSSTTAKCELKYYIRRTHILVTSNCRKS